MEMTPVEEFRIKHLRVAEWLQRTGAPGVLLLSRANVSWLALGGQVLYPTSRSSAFVVTPQGCTLLCPEDDAHRIQQEEIRGLDIDVLPVRRLGGHHLAEVAREKWSDQLLCDIPGFGFEVKEEIHTFRLQLLPPELLQLRRLAHDLTLAIEGVASECYRGSLETDVAGRLGAECVRARIQPVSLLVGADARMEYAHPIPKSRAAEKKLLLCVRGQRRGLNVGISRTVCLATPDRRDVEEYQRLLQMHARLLHATRSGAVLGSIVEKVIDPAGRRWGLGGLTGYRFPEIEASVDSTKRLEAGETICWTVVGDGFRCQDSHIVHDTRTELITSSESWPSRTLQVDSFQYELPDMLLLA